MPIERESREEEMNEERIDKEIKVPRIKAERELKVKLKQTDKREIATPSM